MGSESCEFTRQASLTPEASSTLTAKDLTYYEVYTAPMSAMISMVEKIGEWVKEIFSVDPQGAEVLAQTPIPAEEQTQACSAVNQAGDYRDPAGLNPQETELLVCASVVSWLPLGNHTYFALVQPDGSFDVAERWGAYGHTVEQTYDELAGTCSQVTDPYLNRRTAQEVFADLKAYDGWDEGGFYPGFDDFKTQPY